ncbi:MAG: hypothetical protein GY711_16585 [bacterium]|nr:hypothetical protein [bacterium]
MAKGKKVLTFDLKKDAPELDELAAAMLGPTGNLRAPAMRLGKTWLVGFHADAYSDRFD